jgi:N-acylneuraminate cytidylyltransferase
MKLAIIPARGGSKRIPRKNIRAFCGLPIIGYSIRAALQSACFDQVVVSTDDPEIAECARSFGAQTPFVRPAHLADDHAITRVVINHAIDACAETFGTKANIVCCLYPTAPFVRATDLAAALAQLDVAQADGPGFQPTDAGHCFKPEFVFSATEYPFPIQRALRRNPNGSVEMFNPRYRNTRSQDLEPAFHDAGQFYCGYSHAFLAGHPMFGSQSLPFLLPAYRVCDLDTPADWERAELLWTVLQQRGETDALGHHP